MPDITIIIVSWNSRRDLERCLPSLVAGSRQHAFELILVDNASSDDSVAYTRSIIPEAHIIASTANTGFAHANNQAMTIAHGRYVCLLNPDTIVHDGALDDLMAFMDGRSDVWVTGPALLNGDGTPQRTGVRFPSLWNITVEAFFLDRIFPGTRLFGAHRELYKTGPDPRAVDFVQGSCIVTRKNVIGKVGGLDEGYFMYFEETDWCKRVAAEGGAVWVVPGARVTHFGGGTLGHYDERRLLHYHASLFRYFRKHHGVAARVGVRAVIMVRSWIRVIVWSIVAILRPALRRDALSAIRGYARIGAFGMPRKGTP